MTQNILTERLTVALKNIGLPFAEIHLEHPADESHGDYSSNAAMTLFGNIKKTVFERIKSPRDLAQKIVDELQKDTELEKIVSKIEIAGPGFINFWLSKEYLHGYLNQIVKLKEIYGMSNHFEGKKVIVEYSSPNIAKPFTVGHLRSTIIGDSISNILEAVGWKVYRDNHLGDWGTQFGKQIYAIQKWGNMNDIERSENPVKNLVALYVKFHEEAEKNPEIENEAREIFKRLENGDKKIRIMWEKCVEWSWKEFNKLYKTLRINVDKFENNGRGYGESYFEDKMDSVIFELKEKKIMTKSNDAWLVFFPEDKYPPMMIIKQDGATLYATRDLATDKFRFKKYGRDVTIINEVGAEQQLYFQQLFEIEKLLKWINEDQRVHVMHGLYRFDDHKMSTRKGNTIWLEDVLNEAEKRAKKLSNNTKSEGDLHDETKKETHSISARNIILSKSELTSNAQSIAISALKWNDLKRNSKQTIVFDWEDILNMQGNSGPYMQYTYVRCQSLLVKSKEQMAIGSKLHLSSINILDEEFSILRTLYKYPEVVLEAGKQFAPNLIANYLYDLAQKFNSFYQKVPILKSTGEEKTFRLALTQATAQSIKNGLNLLGIETLEKM